MDNPNAGMPQPPGPYDYRAAPPPRKSSLWKWVLGCGCLVVVLVIVGIVGAVAGGAYWVSKSFTTDPVKAKEIADGIVKFEVPKGYEMKGAVNMMGVKFALFGRPNESDSGLFCFMMAFPKKLGLSAKDMENQMNKQVKDKGGRGEMKVESSGEETIVVDGKEVKAQKNVMTSQDGKGKTIVYQILLDKPESAVMIQIGGPEQGFDQEGFSAFIKSLK